MIYLNIDSIFSLLSTRYSHTDIPTKNQIEILRSFILIAHFRYSSISSWCKKPLQDPLLAFFIGCLPYMTPTVSCHYDFINRLFPKNFHLSIFPVNFHKKYKDKSKKNEKLENVKPNTINNLVDSFDVSYSNDNDEFVQSLYFSC